MTTLTYGATTLTLPDDLPWTDEFSWPAVEQRTEYSITGALIVEASAKQSGRPITLTANENRGWISRATLLTLKAWAALPAQAFTLVINGGARVVAFDQQRGAIEAVTVLPQLTDTDAADEYIPTLRFIEV